MSSGTFKNWKFWPVKATKIVANGEVLVAGTVLVKFAVVNGSNGLFPSLPSETYKDKSTGETKYSARVRFPDKNTFASFQKEAIEAYNASLTPSSSVGEGSQDVDDLPF